MVANHYRYSSRQLISIFQTVTVAELGIKGPLQYLQVSATTLVSLLFIYMISIDCKTTNFSLCLWYSTIYRDHEGFGGFGPKLSPKNQLDIYFLRVWEYCLEIAKPKNVFRLILNPSIKSYEILKFHI